ncbi:hypothetical protein CISG_05796 [Coccidioides immitis RMSCC 3703]|uniref:Uncharacterized protein n=1 Tax=Coccidioides immitis RMSCC 3703 TaxID=454286 RepID=A0A0J8QZ54_COCIT|nr:hypothetical protein CISG_05796 [Coccidioides immitis RMSCC 3703]
MTTIKPLVEQTSTLLLMDRCRASDQGDCLIVRVVKAEGWHPISDTQLQSQPAGAIGSVTGRIRPRETVTPHDVADHAK